MIKLGILGFAGSIGSRHGKNLMWLGHQVIGYDPLMPGKHTREQVLEQSDAVIICTPTREHFVDMVDAHGKHVFVEKPIAFDAPAPAVRSFCQGKSSMGQVVAVGFMCRFHACVIQAKELIQNRIIGDIGWAEFFVDQKSDKSPYLRDGVIRNWASHEIDLALHLLGPAEASEILYIDAPKGRDAVVEFGLKHQSGTYTTIHADYITEPSRRGFRIIGTKGIIEADLIKRTIRCGDNFWQMKDSWDNNYLDEIKHFIAACEKGQIHKSDQLASGLEGAEVLDIVNSLRSMAGLRDDEA